MNFLQTNDWADFQRTLGREVFDYQGNGIKAFVVEHKLPLGKSYLYIPGGPAFAPLELRTDRPSSAPLELPMGRPIFLSLDQTSHFSPDSVEFFSQVKKFCSFLNQIAERQKPIFIKAEPVSNKLAQALVKMGFKKSNKQIQPQQTVVIDLSSSETELLDRMHHKMRYNVKTAERQGVVVEKSDGSGDLETFLELLKKTAARDKFAIHSSNYYLKLQNFFHGRQIAVDLFLAKAGVQVLAGALILSWQNYGYYLHGASDYDYRGLMAPAKLHWEIMKWLKNNGRKYYDLWGIDAHHWPGVTRFKLGWGGQVVEYPGTFDLIISQPWYLIYNLIRKIKF